MATFLHDHIEPFLFQDQIWSIMSFDEGINIKIMRRIFEQTAAMLNKYSKVLLVRAELYISDYASQNKAMSRFMKLFVQRLKQRYNSEIGYIWVREHGKGEKQHYHLAFMLNGHKVRHPATLHSIAKELCQEMGVFHYSITENGFYLIRRNDTESIQAAIYRVSYLAKNHTKGNRPTQTKDYQASRHTNLLKKQH